MLNFAHLPVIDNHSHPFETDAGQTTPERLARLFFHGIGDIPQAGVKKARMWGTSDDLGHHIKNMGVVYTLLYQLSQLFGCPPELEAVAAERNRRASGNLAEYAKLLFQDGGIVASVLDTGLPGDDPLLKLIPGKIMRLVQMDPLIDKLLEQTASYRELLRLYQGKLDGAIRQGGFVGVKCHLAERVGLGIEPVSETEAQNVFSDAKAGKTDAHKKLYAGLFTATLLQCQDLGVPVHLHAGCTGGLWDGPIFDADPFLLIPFLRQPRFLQTRIVLLHAGYPWLHHAAEMAHTLPHVWVDMSWTTPWTSLRLTECYRDVIGIAPLSKVIFGTGGHDAPEIAWLAAKTAKIALAEALGDAVRLELLSPSQAERVGRMILHDNAAALYRLNAS